MVAVKLTTNPPQWLYLGSQAENKDAVFAAIIRNMYEVPHMRNVVSGSQKPDVKMTQFSCQPQWATVSKLVANANY